MEESPLAHPDALNPLLRSGMLAVADDVAAKEWHKLDDGLRILHSRPLIRNERHNLTCLWGLHATEHWKIYRSARAASLL